MTAGPGPHFGVVVLTMGQRPADLRRGLESVLAQEGVTTDIVVVGNGWGPGDLPDGVRGHALAENVGIPAGRNAGVPRSPATCSSSSTTMRRWPPRHACPVRRDLRERPEVGLIQPRVADPTGRPAPGRLGAPSCARATRREPGPATSLWEGAVAIRRDVFDEPGRLAGPVLLRA